MLSEQAVFAYKCGDVYHPEDEGGLRYDDADIGIVWPGRDTPILSEKVRTGRRCARSASNCDAASAAEVRS